MPVSEYGYTPASAAAPTGSLFADLDRDGGGRALW